MLSYYCRDSGRMWDVEHPERKLDELASFAGSSWTEIVRALISNRHAELHSVKEPKSVEADPAQMILDEILSHEIGVDQ